MLKEISIFNNKNQKLAGVLHKNKSKELIILCHGYKSSKDFPAIKNIASRLFEKGYTVYRFDFTGHGESEGFAHIDLIQQVQDIGEVIKYFQDEYNKIILIGGSFAGFVTAIAAIKYPKIQRLVTINGVFDLSKFGIKSFLLKIFQRKELIFFRKNFVPEDIRIPTLVIYARHDLIVNPSQSKEFYEKLKTKKKFEVLEESDHGLSKKDYCNAAADKTIAGFSS
tara:strand:- start:10772 stop:11443 length:672 start_codon:yes stop_codon:yes gene_type:complete